MAGQLEQLREELVELPLAGPLILVELLVQTEKTLMELEEEAVVVVLEAVVGELVVVVRMPLIPAWLEVTGRNLVVLEAAEVRVLEQAELVPLGLL
jgi:hypothetical protein